MMKKLLALLLAAAICCLTSACSKSDDGPDLRSEADALVGTWQTTTHRWVWYENGKRVDAATDPDDWFTLQLTADGQYHWREEDDYVSSEDDGRYTYDTSSHLLRLLDAGLGLDFGLASAVVTRLTENRLELSWTDEWYEDGIDYREENTLSFRRIE